MALTSVSLDTSVEMYLAPAATGVYDWQTIPAALRSKDVVIQRGSENLNSEPVPGRCALSLHDTAGDFVEKNPVGQWFGSIRRGVMTRISVMRVDDQCGRTVADTNWGSVGNTAGDTWTAGTSSGGTVAAGDWSVSSGSARHSLPTDGAYRVSELSKLDRLHGDGECRIRIKVPTSNVTGTGALATEVWFRATDVNNLLAVSMAFLTDETIQIAIYDRTSGTNRYLLAYTTISGLNLATTGVDYDLRCHVEGSTLRAKVWQTGQPEPMDWQVYASGAVIREGYLAIADYVFAGNTNTKPLVFQHDLIQFRLVPFTGEISDIELDGDDKADPKITSIKLTDIIGRLQAPGGMSTKSSMRRGRTSSRRWILIAGPSATGGDTRTAIVPTASLGGIQVGDQFFLYDAITGRRKEDTQFTILAGTVVGSDTHLGFTPDARDSVISGDILTTYRPKGPTTMPIAYWPMEDGARATQISSGLPGGAPLSVVGSPNFGADSSYPSSAPLLQLNDAELTGTVPDYDDVNQSFTLTFCLTMPSSDEAATGQDLIQFYASGTGYSYDLQYTATGNGSLKLLVFGTAGGAALFDSGNIDLGLRGNRKEVTLFLRQVGGAVTYNLFVRSLDGTGGGVGPSTVTGVTTLGKILQVRVNPGGGYDNVTCGHLTVVPDVWEFLATFADFLGWSDEPAIRRLLRLCLEESIPFTYRSDWDIVTTNLGPQKVSKIIDLFKQVPESDGGFLYGAKGGMSLEYCTRGALTNQLAAATFSVSSGQVLPPFRPKVDYSAAKNLVTVERIDGTESVAELDSGPMSTQDPPVGIGVRDRKYSISLGSDAQTIDHANYRLGLGTVDQYRVPELRVTSAGSGRISVERLLSIDIGRRVDITDMDAAKNIYDTLPQLVTGYTLRLGDRFVPEMTMNCVPYAPFQVLALTDDAYAVPQAADTVIGSTLTTTQTGSLTLVSTSGFYPWTTLSTDFPQNIFIDGELVTISGVTGESSPQTAIITARSVNGVVKSHAVGATVTYAQDNYWAFR